MTTKLFRSIKNQSCLFRHNPMILNANNLNKAFTSPSNDHSQEKSIVIDSKIKKIDVKNIDKFVDIETHTGHKFAENDYRLARFINGKIKKVNPRFAIDLIAEIPPIAVKGRKVSCDGGGGPLGHPKVFINLDQPGNHTCGYCGLRFFQEHTDHH